MKDIKINIILAISIIGIIAFFCKVVLEEKINYKNQTHNIKYDITECDNYNETHKHIYKLDMEYRVKKNALINEIDSFIFKNAPNSNLFGGYIVDECIRGDYFDVVLLLSQGFKESHFGSFGLAIKTNSVFNVGAYDNKTYCEINKMFKYADPNNSIKPYINLMNNRYLVGKLPSDLLSNFVDINGKRYASYEHYERDLNNIYNKICNNTSIHAKYSELVMFHKKLSNIY